MFVGETVEPRFQIVAESNLTLSNSTFELGQCTRRLLTVIFAMLSLLILHLTTLSLNENSLSVMPAQGSAVGGTGVGGTGVRVGDGKLVAVWLTTAVAVTVGSSVGV